VVLFFVTDRYRLPWVSVLYPLAGLGLADMVGVLRRRRARETAAALGVVAAFAFQCGFPLVDTRPGLAHMHNLSGTPHYQTGDLPSAKVEFQQALDIDPQSAETMNNLGRVALLSRNAGEAEGWFRKAVQADPRLPEAYFNLEELYRNRGQRREALQSIENLERNVPAGAVQWRPALAYRRGLNHLLLGDSVTARAELEEAIRLKPDLAGAHAALGGLHSAAGRTDEAMAAFRSAAALAPDYFGHHYNMGLVAERRRDYPAALSFYREAGRLAPDNPAVAYRAGVMLNLMGRPEEARNAFQTLAGRGHGPSLYQVGRMLEMEGRPEDARRAYEKAIQAGGPEPEISEARKRFHAIKGNF
jgi:tetratricopeptide (TPR) repeat protein